MHFQSQHFDINSLTFYSSVWHYINDIWLYSCKTLFDTQFERYHKRSTLLQDRGHVTGLTTVIITKLLVWHVQPQGINGVHEHFLFNPTRPTKRIPVVRCNVCLLIAPFAPTFAPTAYYRRLKITGILNSSPGSSLYITIIV